MSFDFSVWTSAYRTAASNLFGDRIVCAGLQGSRARNEARPDSDIDAVLILDRLSADDLSACRAMFHTLPDSELICGFVSGQSELAHWDPGELVSFYFDTQPLIGSLAFLRPLITREAAMHAVHTGACGIYHACCHGFVFGNDTAPLRELYKAAFFVLRVKHFAQTGVFVKKSADLAPLLESADREILRSYLQTAPEDPDRTDALRKTDALLA